MSQANPQTPGPDALVSCSNCGAANRREARLCYRCRSPLPGPSDSTLQPPAATLAEIRIGDTPLPPPSSTATTVPGIRPESGPAGQAAETLPAQTVGALSTDHAPAEGVTLMRVPTLSGGTRPLGARPDFPPRPEGSFFSRRYEYDDLVTSDGALNVYRVLDSRPLVVCLNPACDLRGVSQSAGEGGPCPQCGAALADSRSARKRIKESLAPDVLGSEPDIAQRGLAHAGLLAPTHYFAERLGSDVRHCVVAPEPSPERAARLQPPQPVDAVLQWGIDLAQGLAHLHAHRITFAPGGLSAEALAEHIAFTPHGAAWVDFAACRAWPLEMPVERMSEDGSRDLRPLAAELLALLTGSRDLGEVSAGALSGPVREFFVQALPPGPGFASATDMAAALTALRVQLASVPPPPAFRVDLCIGRATHVGQVRTLNEDSLMVMETVRIHESQARPLGLFVVADGMGGQESGEVASRVAVEAIAARASADLFSNAGPPDVAAWIAAAAEAAHAAVAERREAAQSDMGSTLVMAVVDGVTASVAGIGDSRAYLIEASGELHQLTTDDSLVQRLLSANQITADEARQHPKRSVILRALGSGAFRSPDVVARELYLGDRLLICSDGLTSMLDDSMIAQLVASREAASPQEICGRLIEAANTSGGEDNVSVIIVEVVPLP